MTMLRPSASVSAAAVAQRAAGGQTCTVRVSCVALRSRAPSSRRGQCRRRLHQHHHHRPRNGLPSSCSPAGSQHEHHQSASCSARALPETAAPPLVIRRPADSWRGRHRSPATLSISWTPDRMVIVRDRDQDGGGGGSPEKTWVVEPAVLRDSCPCARCRDASSGQKTFASTEIPPGIGFSSVRVKEGGALGVRFEGEIGRFGDWEHEVGLLGGVRPGRPWSWLWSSDGHAAGSPGAEAEAGTGTGTAPAPAPAPAQRPPRSSSPLPPPDVYPPASRPPPPPPPPHAAPPNNLVLRKQALLSRAGLHYWDAASLPRHIRKVDYHAFMRGPSSSSSSPSPSSPDQNHPHEEAMISPFWQVIASLLRLGIAHLVNVPRDATSVTKIATRIANIRETLYGRTFDVRAKPRAENVAYTAGHLGLHQDLCYLAPPPMIQVLHCMDNSCAGGESLFSDGERVGRLLWELMARSPAGSRLGLLASHRVPYQYDRNGHFYRAERPVLEGSGSTFAGVYWSPPFQGGYHHHDHHNGGVVDVVGGGPGGGRGPVRTDPDLKEWIPAARLFESLVNDAAAVHTCKMEEGECVLFDNLRVLHGRNAFDAEGGGSRWLRGAYISAEDFLSRAAHLPWAPGTGTMDRAGSALTGGTGTMDRARSELMRGTWFADVERRVGEVEGLSL